VEISGDGVAHQHLMGDTNYFLIIEADMAELGQSTISEGLQYNFKPKFRLCCIGTYKKSQWF
jgi:hypothetical protein